MGGVNPMIMMAVPNGALKIGDELSLHAMKIVRHDTPITDRDPIGIVRVRVHDVNSSDHSCNDIVTFGY